MKNVYVADTDKVLIICPKCKSEKKIDVTAFKDTNKNLKAKCQCGEVFRFTLDFRKHYRKSVRFRGEYIVQGKYEKGEIIIENISADGIKFICIRPHNLSKGDIVELNFTLNDPTNTEIQEVVKIIWIMDNNVGAQYIDPKSLVWDFISKYNLF